MGRALFDSFSPVDIGAELLQDGPGLVRYDVIGVGHVPEVELDEDRHRHGVPEAVALRVGGQLQFLEAQGSAIRRHVTSESARTPVVENKRMSILV